MRPIGSRELAFIAWTALLSSSCGGSPEYVLVGSARAPGADGTVDTEEIDESGMLVQIHMERLPPPRFLGEGLQSYVVWFEGENGKRIKAGILDYNEEMRTGDMAGTAPSRQCKIRITAEKSGEVETPGSLTIVERVLAED